MNTVATLFSEAARADPARPLLTYYDDATGERTELSYLTMDNWVSKTANLLIDGAATEPGEKAELVLPPHWLGAAIMLGCWRAGLTMVHGRVAAHGDETSRPRPHVLFTDESAGEPETTPLSESYTVATAPMALGVRDPAARQRVADGDTSDFLVEVRGHGDHFSGAPVDPTAPALAGLPGGRQLSQEQLVTAAVDRVRELNISPGERIMFSADRIPPLDWVLVPLAAKGSVVISRNTDTDVEKRAAAEHARLL